MHKNGYRNRKFKKSEHNRWKQDNKSNELAI